MNEHTKRPLLPAINSVDNEWKVNDYRLLSQFMIYPDSRQPYRNTYQMIDTLADTLMHLERMRAPMEERLSFGIGNRYVRLGAWFK
jgi:hypothetical protein